MKEKTKYSKDELKEFEKIILKKLESAKKDFEVFKNTINHKNSNDIKDTSSTFKTLEEGANVLSKEEMGKLAQRQSKFIKHLEFALLRIENGTYGICRKTGKIISKERLMSVPHATLSINAKRNETNNG